MSQGDRTAFEQVCPICPCFSMQSPWMSCPKLLLSMGLVCACPGVSSIILAGTPRSSLPLSQIIDQACQEAETYKDAGVDGLIVENMHDVPYTVCPGPEVTAAMAVLSAAIRQSCPRVPLGVQVLCAANQQAICFLLFSGLDFIRAEGFVFSHVADEGIINACAGDLLRYRKHIGAENIQIFADIKKKHSAHALTADGRFPPAPLRPRSSCEVKHAVKIPVLVGSGVTLENVKNYLDADALIIGSYFKKEGYWANAVDPDRVKKFMEHISKLRE
ncbi:PREDICTED: LOW QUALITY PROTEIN: uncharacterized protein F13E9.13, mitochondrial [Corvus brachyrhynchos]|uniref:LOW QUALITY PROTEIN: uncharacterized protein F13E9.13, mitochondrial n=1 Tax=Corvus brachyrhynchos TaxID=85066 RepID=UPI0008167DA0|nr:PREDICTED: LOW QUALITY PROTEIN: uncharacterized protein F13E9.13, mitochondrial [Corvus brachyrhynchos]